MHTLPRLLILVDRRRKELIPVSSLPLSPSFLKSQELLGLLKHKPPSVTDISEKHSSSFVGKAVLSLVLFTFITVAQCGSRKKTA